jgi:two-component system chemotaxis response regulator CheY
MRRIVTNTLKRIGIDDALEAASGDAALKACADGVDLVITDWNMPGMSGIELVRWLRDADATATVPILMMITDEVRDHLIEAGQNGVTGYLVKPFTAETAREKIQQVLSHPLIAA